MTKSVAVLLLVLGLSGPSPAQTPGATSGTQLILGNAIFSKVGDRYFYPHMEGVFETFTEADGILSGDLGSRFSMDDSIFENRFRISRNLEALKSPDKEIQIQAAENLLRFNERRGPTFYLGNSADKGPTPLEIIKTTLNLRQYNRILADEKNLQNLFTSLTVAKKVLSKQNPRSCQSYYEDLIEDSYLDVAVIGGNQDGTAESYINQLQAQLEKDGFSLDDDDQFDRILEKKIFLKNRDVVVRVRMTFAEKGEINSISGVNNFAEGFAKADLMIYTGHSNYGTGKYYVSEDKTKFSTFKIGLDHTKDFQQKLTNLGEKSYQIFAFDSCRSMPKYGAAVRRYYMNFLNQSPGIIGTLGDSNFGDFAPRMTALLHGLMAGQCSRSIHEAVNEADTGATDSPPILMRGLLQSENTFIIPKSEQITSMQRQDTWSPYLNFGNSKTGHSYISTDVFPQDYPGEVVQIILIKPNLIYGLLDSGKLVFINASHQKIITNTIEESSITAKYTDKVRDLTAVQFGVTHYLLALDENGQIFQIQDNDAKASPAKFQLPKGQKAVRLQYDNKGRLLAITEAGKYFYLGGVLGPVWKPLQESKILLQQRYPNLLLDKDITLAAPIDSAAKH